MANYTKAIKCDVCGVTLGRGYLPSQYARDFVYVHKVIKHGIDEKE